MDRVKLENREEKQPAYQHKGHGQWRDFVRSQKCGEAGERQGAQRRPADEIDKHRGGWDRACLEILAGEGDMRERN
ncbi:hypothetical protein D3C71_2186730 [compost metagenome]